MSYNVALNFGDGKTHFVTVAANENVADAARHQGINIPVDCREGVCATCRGLCTSGDYELEYVDEDALSAEDLEQRAVLTCQMRAKSNCSVSFDFDSSICTSAGPEFVKGKVAAVELISESTAILRIDASETTKSLIFLPGQYAHIHVPGTEEWRSYSFAHNPNANNQLQFLIRRLPQGVMSDYLRERVCVGDEIELKAPLGAFYLHQITRPLIMIAGGTGLAAFMGMLDDLAESGQAVPPIMLFYGVTNVGDVCEVERLNHYLKTINGFSYQTIVMNADDSWPGPVGVVTDLITEADVNGGDVDAYMCGPPPMVDAVKAWFDNRKMSGHTIHYEKFSAS